MCIYNFEQNKYVAVSKCHENKCRYKLKSSVVFLFAWASIRFPHDTRTTRFYQMDEYFTDWRNSLCSQIQCHCMCSRMRSLDVRSTSFILLLQSYCVNDRSQKTRSNDCAKKRYTEIHCHLRNDVLATCYSSAFVIASFSGYFRQTRVRRILVNHFGIDSRHWHSSKNTNRQTVIEFRFCSHICIIVVQQTTRFVR